MKYTSIENHYQEKHIQYYLDHYPRLTSGQYAISEKIDGANMGVIFEFDSDNNFSVKLRSRKPILKDDDYKGCYGLRVTFERIDEKYHISEAFKEFMEENDISKIILYGEHFGKGVLKRINYGDRKDIRFFDIFINIASDGTINNNCLSTPKEFLTVMDSLGLGDLVIPITIVNSFEEALEYDTDIPSLYSPTKDRIEGVVIKLYDFTIQNEDTKPFYLKKKNPEFNEIKPERKEKSDPKLLPFYDDVLSYVNENRVISAYSKLGMIESKKDIGKYLNEIAEDVLKDYNKDHPNETLDRKQIAFASSKIVKILMKEL